MEYKKIVRKIQSKKNSTIPEQVNAIKKNVSAGQYKDALKMHPLYLKCVQQTPFFETVKDIHIKNPFTFTNDFRKEFKWVTNLIRPYLSTIDNFLAQKNKFEKQIILCKYEEANISLISIEKEFGVTLWSIEANFIIKEYLSGSKGNWNELSYYLNEINNPIYEFIINSSSKRVESKLSYESYLSQFQNDLDNINSVHVLKDFFVFKSCNLANYPYHHKGLEGILFVANAFSIIDLYLVLVDVMLYKVSQSIDNDETIFQFVKSSYLTVSNDHRLGNIFNVLNPNGEFIQREGYRDIIDCSNMYYSGKFNDSFKQSLNGIENHPLEFEFYSIYCRSLLNLDEDFRPAGLSERIDMILEEVYNLLSFSKDRESSFPKLLKSSLFFMNSPFGKQIFGLIAEVEGIARLHYNIGILSNEYTSYKTVKFAAARPQVKDNLGILYNEHCFKVYNYKLGDEVVFENTISESKLQSESSNVVRLFSLKDYTAVIERLTESTELDSSQYHYERKLSMLFFSYLEMNMIREALILFGSIYFNDALVVRKLDFQRLYNIIDKQDSKDEYFDLIEYSVLASLIVKEFDLYEIYDEFMCATQIYEITEIDLEYFVEKYSLKTTITFLENVATIDTLKYSSDYGSISEVEQVRVKILKKLMSIDSDNKLKHEKELNEIYRITSIRKVLKEVDEGRLYIDIDKLKEIQVKNLMMSFCDLKKLRTSLNLKQ
ncbi:hypothetical protein [Cyclobacterium qasimii]|uniref:Reticulocyte binding protein n=1 Tax=Cyclobacterium qasimii M12-11B TaxID=641524 RepID=S7WGC1_9BACT|nr:hypothetical protein [Cyclobacterium qasimii]EPR65804.1 reticulocyte binding protein [Cyclobacterium qasimii M12-11B]